MVQATVVSASLIRAIFPQVLLPGVKLVEVIDIYGDSASTDFLYESLEGEPPQIEKSRRLKAIALGGKRCCSSVSISSEMRVSFRRVGSSLSSLLERFDFRGCDAGEWRRHRRYSFGESGWARGDRPGL